MRYRPIDVRLWSDRRFLGLSDQGKLLWIFLLTTPSTIPIPGVIVGGAASLAEQLGWTPELFRGVFQELVESGLKVRAEGRVVWLTNALKYQPPRNPNMVKAWAKFWDDIPEGALKKEIWQALKIACKSWSVLFNKLFPEVFGELFAQLSLGVFDTGTGTGTGTTTGTGTGTGSSTRVPAEPGTVESQPEKVRPLPDPQAEAGARKLLDLVACNTPDGTVAKLTEAGKQQKARRWADAFRLMHDRDGHSWEAIDAMVDWSQADPFWRSNILSGDKLREKWDQLAARMQQQRAAPQHASPPRETGLEAALRIARGD